MQLAPKESNSFVGVIAALALLPGVAAVLYYALDPGLRAELGWHAAWLFVWCGACIVLLGRGLKRRSASLRSTPPRNHRRTRPDDLAGPLMPL